MRQSSRLVSVLLSVLLLLTPVRVYASGQEGVLPAQDAVLSAQEETLPAQDAYASAPLSVSAIDYVPSEEGADPDAEETPDPEGASDPEGTLDPKEEAITDEARNAEGTGENTGNTGPATPSYLFIGDSYLAGLGISGQPFGRRFQTLMNLDDTTYRENAVIGAGFISAGSGRKGPFLNQMTETADAMTQEEREGITDLYVLGGWNDCGNTREAIQTAVSDFMGRAHTLFPNAVLHIGMLSYSKRPEAAKLEAVKEAYYALSGEQTDPSDNSTYEIGIIEGIEYILPAHADDCLLGDNLHPSDAGHTYLAQALVSYAEGNGTGGSPVIGIQSIALSHTSLSVRAGEEATLTAQIAPENATVKAVVWSSSDPAVATVSSQGVVTAVSAGSAVITAEATDNSGIRASCTVWVSAAALQNGPQGWGVYRNGRINPAVTDVIKNEHGWWYVQNGRVTFRYNGVARNANGLWYIKDSKVDFNVNGVVKAGNGIWYYFNGGKVQEAFSGLRKNEHGWWYVDKGQVRFNYNGLVKNEHGWWYVQKSGITFAYNGVARNANGLWYIKDSKVDFSVNGVMNPGNGVWYYFQGGKVQETYSGLKQNANGWWYVDKGQVRFNYNGLVKNEYGWWYVQNSKITFAYNGVARNEYGLWYIRNSKVDFGVSGVVKVAGTWYYFSGGKVQEDYNGVQRNVNGLWYIRNGKVDFSVNGVAKAGNNWYTFDGGKVVESVAQGRALFVGDSRTIDLFADSDAEIKGQSRDGFLIYAKHSQEFDYLKQTVDGLNTNSWDVLVSWMGANDAGVFKNYQTYYEGLLKKGKRLILCTVGPTIDSRLSAADRGYGFENKNMESYNNELKAWAAKNNVKVIDLYTYIRAGNGVGTDNDGIHYSPKPNPPLWNYIVTQTNG